MYHNSSSVQFHSLTHVFTAGCLQGGFSMLTACTSSCTTFLGREWHRSSHLCSVVCDKWIQSIRIVLRCRITMLHSGIYYRTITISSCTNQAVLSHNFIIEVTDITYSLRDMEMMKVKKPQVWHTKTYFVNSVYIQLCSTKLALL